MYIFYWYECYWVICSLPLCLQQQKTSPKLQYDCHSKSVLIICTDTLTLGLLLASDKLDKMILSSAKPFISNADRCDVFTMNKKISDNNTAQPIYKQLQPNSDIEILFHTKQDIMSLYPDFLTELG